MATDFQFRLATTAKLAALRSRRAWLWMSVWCLAGAIASPPTVAAFCGFYVAGADAKLYANATMVVLMRDGTRTVLSIQNNYQGPAEAFALVIPVPSVLNKNQVRTLPKAVFEHVDALGAPRLVEYWEADPCAPLERDTDDLLSGMDPELAEAGRSRTVKIEARFEVGEYDVVILSASDSTGLEQWLHQNHYAIPNGAGAVLAAYVAAGTKFFVAKVDPKRVVFKNGQAVLSPLRFHYDTPDFTLPVRLGLLNSKGKQDLIVNILAPERYEVANYANVSIPTNLRVHNAVRSNFAGFYEALFSRLLDENPGAVVSEYAWDAQSCDPCPVPPLDSAELLTLGADVTGPEPTSRYTLTRLHYRYTRETLGEDLVFRRAGALTGGRGIPDAKGVLRHDAASDPPFNAFQGRYVILHSWTNPVKCASPVRGHWDGPDARSPAVQAAQNTLLTGSVPRAVDLASMLAQPLPPLHSPKAPSPHGIAPAPKQPGKH